jgi:signal transduction histidine kinase
MNGERELLLVVDDTETARYTKARVLRAAGFDVLEAATGQDGLRIARELKPRLVVLDVRLPDINGWEVCRRLKTELSVLVLQVSATFVTDADTVRALEAGADSCLTEPLDGMVLVATVRALLRVRHAEDALRQTLARELAAREAADAANRAKDTFLATLSHELRTPMSAILTWAVVLRDQRLDADQRLRAADAIVRNANLQVRLIDDLLDVSRVVSGKMRLELGPVALNDVVSAAIDFIRPAADAKALQITTRVEPGLGLLYGDASRLQQVVWNLLSNAVKFTPQSGSIAVSLRASGPDAEIEVRDSGRGIEPEFLPFIFDRFRQADSSATRLSGGLGLGLAIVRHLVELHGGSVAAESPGLDQGTTFRVRLPFPANRPRAEFARSIEWTPTGGASLTGVQVLLVDDERDSRDAVAMFLRGAGAEVRTAGSVDEAVQAIEAQSPSIVVSDIAMPDKDGFALLEWLRGHTSEAGGTVPAIALTAFGGPREVEQILDAGFQAYLRKPIEPADLVGTIHQIANSTPDSDTPKVTPNVS